MKISIIIVTLGLSMCANLCAHADVPEEMNDIIWNYVAQRTDVYTGDITNVQHDGYHFDGSEDIEGIRYAIFRTPSGTPYAYVRQEETKVYVRNDKGAVHIVEQNLHEPTKDEYLLYDYSLQPGGRFRSVAFWEDDLTEYCEGIVIEAEVTKVYKKVINNKEFHYIDYSMIDDDGGIMSGYGYSNTVIENIGPHRGIFCAPQLGWWSTATRDIFWYLTSVTTKDGEILWDDPSGVEAIGADAVPSGDGTIYDLHGRRVVNPLPGSVYIRDGRKYVAR